MQPEVSVKGVDKAVRRLERLAKHSNDFRPVWNSTVLPAMLKVEREKFLTGKGWKALDPDTKKRKARQGKPARKLVDTGTLERALTVKHAPGQRLKIERHFMVFGLEPNGVAYYGKFHHRGKGNPRRRLITTPARFRKQVAADMLDHLLR